MSSLALLRARIAELEAENIYLQEQVVVSAPPALVQRPSLLVRQMQSKSAKITAVQDGDEEEEEEEEEEEGEEEAVAAVEEAERLRQVEEAQPLIYPVPHSSLHTSASLPILHSSSSPSNLAPDSDDTSAATSAANATAELELRLQAQSMLLAQVKAENAALIQENQLLLNAKSTSTALSMSFSLMDNLKREKAELEKHCHALQLQLFIYEKGTHPRRYHHSSLSFSSSASSSDKQEISRLSNSILSRFGGARASTISLAEVRTYVEKEFGAETMSKFKQEIKHLVLEEISRAEDDAPAEKTTTLGVPSSSDPPSALQLSTLTLPSATSSASSDGISIFADEEKASSLSDEQKSVDSASSHASPSNSSASSLPPSSSISSSSSPAQSPMNSSTTASSPLTSSGSPKALTLTSSSSSSPEVKSPKESSASSSSQSPSPEPQLKSPNHRARESSANEKRAAGMFSPSNASQADSASTPSAAVSSSSSAHSPSVSLRVTSNRLAFMEDSPLYRQQVNQMRVRVSQMFSRLDALAEKAGDYAKSAESFAKAGAIFAKELNRPWGDVEVEDDAQEHAQIEQALARSKRKAAKAAKLSREARGEVRPSASKKEATVAATPSTASSNSSSSPSSAPSSSSPSLPSNTSPVPSRGSSRRSTAEGTSSASIAEAATLDSAFLKIGLARNPLDHSNHNGAPSSSSPSSSSSSLTSSATGSALRAGLTIKSFLSDIQAKVSDVLVGDSSSSASDDAPMSAPHVADHNQRSFANNRSQSLHNTLTSSSASLTRDQSSKSLMHEDDRQALQLEQLRRSAREKQRAAATASSSSSASASSVHQPLTLGHSISKLANIVTTLSEVTENLSSNLSHIMQTALKSLGEQHRGACKSTMEEMELAMKAYENALDLRLVKRKTPGGLRLNLNMFGQKKVIDEEYQRICVLRREMETRRFDHIALLNEICVHRRSELIEVICASFLAFVTFFHEGWFAAQHEKDDVDEMQSNLARRRSFYVKQVKHALAQRMRIAKGALPLNLPVIFPLSSWHQLHVSSKSASISGYLRMPVDETAHPSTSWKGRWIRRWCQLDGGQFSYLNELEFYQPKLITNVLTCAARPWSKSQLDYVFELIHPSRTYIYQAESEYEMKAWVAVFANSTEFLLGQQQTRNDTHALESSLNSSQLERSKRVKASLWAQLRRENPTCADCGQSEPEWASINLGIMICIVCSGIHRSLGVHISKVRSMTLDEWDVELLDMMCAIGNDKSNQVFEGALFGDAKHGSHAIHSSHDGHAKPVATSSREAKEEYIQRKYVKRMLLSRTALNLLASVHGDLSTLQKQFWTAVETDDMMQCILYLALGCSLQWVHNECRFRTLLHRAAEYDATAASEWLLQNNAEINAKDEMGCTPLDVAAFNQSTKVKSRLEQCGGIAGAGPEACRMIALQPLTPPEDKKATPPPLSRRQSSISSVMDRRASISSLTGNLTMKMLPTE